MHRIISFVVPSLSCPLPILSRALACMVSKSVNHCGRMPSVRSRLICCMISLMRVLLFAVLLVVVVVLNRLVPNVLAAASTWSSGMGVLLS